MDELTQARALPFIGDAEKLVAADKAQELDERGFVAIIKIFVRTWPYLVPHVVGYWRELSPDQAPKREESIDVPEIAPTNDKPVGAER